jgi:hypothetical protein
MVFEMFLLYIYSPRWCIPSISTVMQQQIWSHDTFELVVDYISAFFHQ